MKVIKGLGVVVILILVILAGVAFYLINNLNKLVKDGVETHGPNYTQTHVGLAKVDIVPWTGKGELKGFAIGNPEGFKRENLLEWDTVRLQVQPSSLKSDVIVIEDFTIEGVKIVAEQKGYSTNIQELMDTLKSLSSGDQAPAEKADEGEPLDIRLAVKRLRFADNSIDFVTEKFGDYTLDMPSFDLNNLGDTEKGLTPEELASAILQPLLQRAKKSVEKRLKDIAKENLKEKLDEKKEEIKAKAKEKEDELKAEAQEKLDAEEARLDEKKDELKKDLDEKLGEGSANKLKSLFKRD